MSNPRLDTDTELAQTLKDQITANLKKVNKLNSEGKANGRYDQTGLTQDQINYYISYVQRITDLKTLTTINSVLSQIFFNNNTEPSRRHKNNANTTKRNIDLCLSILFSDSFFENIDTAPTLKKTYTEQQDSVNVINICVTVNKIYDEQLLKNMMVAFLMGSLSSSNHISTAAQVNKHNNESKNEALASHSVAGNGSTPAVPSLMTVHNSSSGTDTSRLSSLLGNSFFNHPLFDRNVIGLIFQLLGGRVRCGSDTNNNASNTNLTPKSGPK